MVSYLERDISSLEDLASARTAIELCYDIELKKEILCASGSEYHRYISCGNIYPEGKWREILEKKTTTILEKLGVPRVLWEKVRGLVILIGMKMLEWTKYHEIIGLSLEKSFKFLNSSFHTPNGTVDNNKTAEELMKDISLSISQKYTLACLHCFTGHIPDLYRQLSQEEKEKLGEDINYPEIVKFRTDYMMGRIDELRGEKTLDEYMLEKAIHSGSKEVVEYCLEETSLNGRKNVAMDAALETIIKTPRCCCDNSILFVGDYDLFVKWIPAQYFVDILCFLLSKMNEEQRIEILHKDIEEDSGSIPDAHVPRSRILNYFLNWPYQNYFMKTAKLTWEILPESTYVNVLLRICHKIKPGIEFNQFRFHDTDITNDEGSCYNYRKLLQEFWIQSPNRYKRYVFNDNEIKYCYEGKEVLTHCGDTLVVMLLRLKNNSCEERRNFELILDSTTDEEKRRIVSSQAGIDICVGLIEGQNWEILDDFLSKCTSSKVEVEEFKKRLSFTEEAQQVCAHFIKSKWDAVEFFMKWMCLSEEEIIRFKNEMIFSEYGKDACRYLLLHKGVEFADRFCEWFFYSEEEIRKFKKELIRSLGVESATDLIINDKLEVVDEFINWSNLSQEEIREFKKDLLDEKGNVICENLISGGVRMPIYFKSRFMFDQTIQFQGGKWEQVEKFLTWCFSTEEEIRDFKKNRLLKLLGREIHFRLIESNQPKEAETYFDWLELSSDEVKELKKETLFNHTNTFKMFFPLMYRSKDDVVFSDYGSKQERIELFFRWYLTDEETVLEFTDRFKEKYEGIVMSEEDMSVLKDFDSAIEQRLSDLKEEQRKCELSKDLCNVELKKKVE